MTVITPITPIKQELKQVSRRGFITNLEGSRRGFITNYPNPTQWNPLNETDVMSREPLNIYVHIPFCAQQCSYCYYRVVTGAKRDEMNRYADALCQEMAMAAERYNLKDRPIRSIYFGGGTPTMLQREQLERITQGIRDNFNHIMPNAEFTIEGEPVSMTQKTADAFRDLPIPVTRISMGVQSLDDDVVKHTQRKDTVDRVIKAINIAQSVVPNVNIDLMSGLAGETMETWQNSVHRALETGVASITVYKTEVYANSQYFRDLRKSKIRLPDDDEELRYFEYAVDAFEKANYKPWSFFAYTKNGDYPHVHAPSLWRGEDYLPLGTSAFGKIGDQLFQNSNDPEKYMQTIESGHFAVNRGHKLTCQDKMVRTVLVGMKLMKLDLDFFQQATGYRLEKLCAPMVNELQENGFITLNGGEKPTELVMTRKGILHGDYVGKQLGRALQELG
ncbi:coproporphyrinogen-III oxidase family protein [Thiothrix nivea]|uniref:Radical SAM domain protein n=1 Tax=Thiothrix nivea (strain ATCC 35100 / DSM 5205 / JP2) TaxID=870187 RepID=A0A656HKS0_THINJ|nr:coproporphyrinogen-III oxidase family protein [Thiothrix nivea]EIJ36873.1 Radical SAM domain protein [Thiothrix nivea DSM 5205]